MKLCFVPLLVVSVLLASLLAPTTGHAIPAFSRLYKTECKTCHTVFPERNEFGDAFEKNSFVWPGKLPVQAQAKRKLPAAEQQGIDALLNAGLPEVLPVSLMAQHNIVYNSDNVHNGPDFDLDAGTELEIFAAGNFRKQAGFWAEANLEGSVGEIFLQLRHPYNIPFNVKVGKFKPKLSLWKGNDRTSIKGYGYNSLRVPGNDFRIGANQGAVEINQVIGSRVFAAAGVTNGPEPTKDPDGNYNYHNGKDYYAHIEVRVGGTDFLGREPQIDLDHDSVWDYLTLTFGGFGYLGSSMDRTNDFYRTGLESEILYRRLKARLGAIYGHDENPSGGDQSVDSHFAMGQVEYLVGSNLMPSFRFEIQSVDGVGVTRNYIPCISYALLQNLRLAAEYVHQAAPDQTSRQLTGRISFAF